MDSMPSNMPRQLDSMPSNMRQPLRTFNDTSPMEELQRQPQSMRSGPSRKGKVKANEPEPEARVRYVVSVEHLIHLENAQHGAKGVTNVAIKITLVLNAGPSIQEEGTENPAAHLEDTRAKVSHIGPGLEATRQPKVHTAWSQPPFKTIQTTSMEKKQTTSMEKVQTSMDSREETSMDSKEETSMEPQIVLNSLSSHFLPFPGQSLWPASAMTQIQRAKPRSSPCCS